MIRIKLSFIILLYSFSLYAEEWGICRNYRFFHENEILGGGMSGIVFKDKDNPKFVYKVFRNENAFVEELNLINKLKKSVDILGYKEFGFGYKDPFEPDWSNKKLVLYPFMKKKKLVTELTKECNKDGFKPSNLVELFVQIIRYSKRKDHPHGQHEVIVDWKPDNIMRNELGRWILVDAWIENHDYYDYKICRKNFDEQMRINNCLDALNRVLIHHPCDIAFGK